MIEALSTMMSSDVRDVARAARSCHDFSEYINERGYDVTPWQCFIALLRCTPWHLPPSAGAPWRIVRSHCYH